MVLLDCVVWLLMGDVRHLEDEVLRLADADWHGKNVQASPNFVVVDVETEELGQFVAWYVV